MTRTYFPSPAQMRSPVVPPIGGGRTRLQPVHVEDVARSGAAVAPESGPRRRPCGLSSVRLSAAMGLPVSRRPLAVVLRLRRPLSNRMHA
jgi:hypothetical protein